MQNLRAEDCGNRPLAEDGASRTDDDDFRSRSGACFCSARAGCCSLYVSVHAAVLFNRVR
jgi:hypothetical protein